MPLIGGDASILLTRLSIEVSRDLYDLPVEVSIKSLEH